MDGLSCGEESMFSRFDTIPACDVQPIAITCFSIADARKNDVTNLVKQLCIEANIDMTVANILHNNNSVSQICRLIVRDI